MSMLMQIQNEEQKLEMTPMIDVTFLLLIFFMCTIKFKTLEGKLSAYLPKDVGVNTSQAEPIEKVEIFVEVLVAGEKVHPKEGTPWNEAMGVRFAMKGRRIQFKVGPNVYKTSDKLLKSLKKTFEADPERPATISTTTGAEAYIDVVQALDAAIEAGFTDITFAGKPIKKKS